MKRFFIGLLVVSLFSLVSCTFGNTNEAHSPGNYQENSGTTASNQTQPDNSKATAAPKASLEQIWIGKGSGYIYELNITKNGTFTVFYHDLSISDSLDEDNVTWMSGGNLTVNKDCLQFETGVDGQMFTIEYAYILNADGLALKNTGSDRLFSDLELAASENGAEQIFFTAKTTQQNTDY